MILNSTHRGAFVRAVMNDVPKVDYHQQGLDLIAEEAPPLLPTKVQALWKDKGFRPYVKTFVYSSSARSASGQYITGGPSYDIPGVDSERHKPLKAKLDGIAGLAHGQKNKRRELEKTLEDAVAGIRTTKQLLLAFPEFAKYVPKEEPKVDNLPALANVVAGFTKAGWPKGAAKKGAKA